MHTYEMAHLKLFINYLSALTVQNTKSNVCICNYSFASEQGIQITIKQQNN